MKANIPFAIFAVKGFEMAKTAVEKKRKKKIVEKTKPGFPLVAALLVPIGIALITWIAYSGVGEFDWTNWDDPPYVFENEYVVKGDTKSIWKPDAFVMGNYHPIAVYTLILNWKRYGNDAGAFHKSNRSYHILAALFIYFFFWRMTGSVFLAAFTAAIFGVHPMHVESVAWVAARKDQMMALFFFAALWSYIAYLDDVKRKTLWYALAFILFMASMMSKAMAAPFPVVLLLVDFYRKRDFNVRVWLEKIPFFIGSLVLGYWAVVAQKSAEALTMESYPFSEKIFYAGNSIMVYLAKFFAPVNLSAFYPYPDNGVPFTFYITTLMAVALVGLAIWSVRKTRIVLFGFGFFLSMIGLVLQILSVGAAIMADRYTYLPYIGLAFMLGAGLEWLMEKRKTMAYALAGLLVVGFTYLANERTQDWQNTVTIFSDVIEKYPQVPVAYNNRGKYYGFQKQDYNKAFEDLNKAIEVDPEYPNAYVNRGNVYSMRKEMDKAMNDYNMAVELRPKYYDALTNRAITHALQGNYELSLADYSKALEIQPNNSQVYFNRGFTYYQMNDWDACFNDYSKAISLNPSYGQAYYYRSMVQAKKNNLEGGKRDIQMARSLGFPVPSDYAKQFGL